MKWVKFKRLKYSNITMRQKKEFIQKYKIKLFKEKKVFFRTKFLFKIFRKNKIDYLIMKHKIM